jgi:hypothetical protein
MDGVRRVERRAKKPQVLRLTAAEAQIAGTIVLSPAPGAASDRHAFEVGGILNG